MQHKNSYIWHPQTLFLFLGYIGIRLVSFFIQPFAFIEGALVFGLIMGLAAAYFMDVRLAWHLVLFELILGGSGNLLSLGTISLRTLVIYTFLFLWVLHHGGMQGHRHRLKVPHKLFAFVAALGTFGLISALIGLSNGHALARVAADLVPYSYLLLLLPAFHMLHDPDDLKQGFFLRTTVVFVIATAASALLYEVLFSTGIAELHAPLYNWLRDIHAAKLTDMGTGFWRIVFPEHLVVVPGALIVLSLLMRDEKHHVLWRILLGLGMLILVLNFSRTYFLAFTVGLPFLLMRHKLKAWLKEIGVALATMLVIFLSVHLTASLGQSSGFELLVGQFAAIADPSSETSAWTRAQLLQPISEAYLTAPMFGLGLGATLSVPNSIGIDQETDQFDWGWFETGVEMGAVGVMILLALLFFLIRNTLKHVSLATHHRDLHVGIIAAVVSMIVMHIFAPILSHTIGIMLLIFLISLSSVPILSHEMVIHKIYRLFHKHSPFDSQR